MFRASEHTQSGTKQTSSVVLKMIFSNLLESHKFFGYSNVFSHTKAFLVKTSGPEELKNLPLFSVCVCLLGFENTASKKLYRFC